MKDHKRASMNNRNINEISEHRMRQQDVMYSVLNERSEVDKLNSRLQHMGSMEQLMVEKLRQTTE